MINIQGVWNVIQGATKKKKKIPKKLCKVFALYVAYYHFEVHLTSFCAWGTLWYWNKNKMKNSQMLCGPHL